MATTAKRSPAARIADTAAWPALWAVMAAFALAGIPAWAVLRAWNVADRARGIDRSPEVRGFRSGQA